MADLTITTLTTLGEKALKESAEESIDEVNQVDSRELDIFDDALRGYCNNPCNRRDYAQGVFFLDENGNRCVWGPAIDYWFDEREREASHYDIIAIENTFYTSKFNILKKDRTLEEIDQPKPREFVHPSETGWNLPLDHPRHFFKLPEGIQNRIFSYVLTIPSNHSIIPLVRRCNNNHDWALPYWRSTMLGKLLKTGMGKRNQSKQGVISRKRIVTIPRHDSVGPYTEYRVCDQRFIDATLLRTSRYFFQFGINLLYGQAFLFKLEDSRSSTSYINSAVHQPSDTVYPNPSSEVFLQEFELAKARIYSQAPITELHGWFHSDPFLMFLYKIGVSNSARLKYLVFQGIVRTHRCSGIFHPSGECCQDDLVQYMKIYILFIKEFCPNVEKIRLILVADPKSCTEPMHRRRDINGRFVTRNKAIKELLENELRTLEKVWVVEVVSYHFAKKNLEFAEKSIDWFRDRFVKSLREKGIQAGAQVCAKQVIICESCRKEGHKSLECFEVAMSTVIAGRPRKGDPNHPSGW